MKEQERLEVIKRILDNIKGKNRLEKKEYNYKNYLTIQKLNSILNY